jgi:hypothetical protein
MRLWKPALAVVPAVLLLAACSTSVTLPQADLESNIQSRIAADLGVAVEDVTVSCSGDLAGTVGATTNCDVTTADGQSQSFVATTNSVDGTTVGYELAPAS